VKREPLSRGAYKCLKYIKSYDFQRRGWSCPSHETLGKDLSVSTRQIKRYVAELTRKSYVFPQRRPNSSSLYYFGSGKGQNVPTKGTENVPTDVPTDVPTIQLFIMPPKGLPRKPPAKDPNPYLELIRRMIMPAFLTTPNEQKLWRGAQRWIAENKPPFITALDIGPLMKRLEDAGYLNLPEDGPLPRITWPALEATPLVKLTQAVERKPVQSLTAEQYEFLARKIDSQA
jgi:hypothetical protein